MKMGIIGAGMIGGTLATRLVKLGHQVVVANSAWTGDASRARGRDRGHSGHSGPGRPWRRDRGRHDSRTRDDGPAEGPLQWCAC